MENTLLTNYHVLIYFHSERFYNKCPPHIKADLEYILENFCGKVLHGTKDFTPRGDQIIYLCGDIHIDFVESIVNLDYRIIFLLSTFPLSLVKEGYRITGPGSVPINIKN